MKVPNAIANIGTAILIAQPLPLSSNNNYLTYKQVAQIENFLGEMGIKLEKSQINIGSDGTIYITTNDGKTKIIEDNKLKIYLDRIINNNDDNDTTYTLDGFNSQINHIMNSPETPPINYINTEGFNFSGTHDKGISKNIISVMQNNYNNVHVTNIAVIELQNGKDLGIRGDLRIGDKENGISFSIAGIIGQTLVNYTVGERTDKIKGFIEKNIKTFFAGIKTKTEFTNAINKIYAKLGIKLTYTHTIGQNLGEETTVSKTSDSKTITTTKKSFTGGNETELGVNGAYILDGNNEFFGNISLTNKAISEILIGYKHKFNGGTEGIIELNRLLNTGTYKANIWYKVGDILLNTGINKHNGHKNYNIRFGFQYPLDGKEGKKIHIPDYNEKYNPSNIFPYYVNEVYSPTSPVGYINTQTEISTIDLPTPPTTTPPKENIDTPKDNNTTTPEAPKCKINNLHEILRLIEEIQKVQKIAQEAAKKSKKEKWDVLNKYINGKRTIEDTFDEAGESQEYAEKAKKAYEKATDYFKKVQDVAKISCSAEIQKAVQKAKEAYEKTKEAYEKAQKFANEAQEAAKKYAESLNKDK